MALTPDQVRSYAYQYAGLLMLNPDARADYSNSAGDHTAPDFHDNFASFLNRHLAPAQTLSSEDAQQVCEFHAQNCQAFHATMQTIASGQETVWMPFADGMDHDHHQGGN